jgi:formyltetrahydrofolate deformylase
MKNTAVLLLSSPIPLARKGAVAAISQFLIAHNGSVLHTDDHVDSGRAVLLSRLEWDLEGFDIPISDFEEHFKPVAERFRINYHLAMTDHRPKVAILVSAQDHCLADLLYRHRTGELACDIVMVISNHIRNRERKRPRSAASSANSAQAVRSDDRNEKCPGFIAL